MRPAAATLTRININNIQEITHFFTLHDSIQFTSQGGIWTHSSRLHVWANGQGRGWIGVCKSADQLWFVNQICPSIFALNTQSSQKYLNYMQSLKSGPKKLMNPQTAAIAGSGNPLKSRFESEIRAKIFSKSADPFAYSPPLSMP